MPAVSAADGQTPFADAVAVWHMADSHDSAGADSVLKVDGQVKLGIELQGADREASFARGGDGKVAELADGWLNPGLGAGGEPNLRGRVPKLGTGGPENTTSPKAELLLAELARRE